MHVPYQVTNVHAFRMSCSACMPPVPRQVSPLGLVLPTESERLCFVPCYADPMHPSPLQVSLGLVLPTVMAWQLQGRMAASIAAHAQMRQDSAMLQQVRHSQVRRFEGAGLQGMGASAPYALGHLLGSMSQHPAGMLALPAAPSPALSSPAPACPPYCSIPSCAALWPAPPRTLG